MSNLKQKLIYIFRNFFGSIVGTLIKKQFQLSENKVSLCCGLPIITNINQHENEISKRYVSKCKLCGKSCLDYNSDSTKIIECNTKFPNIAVFILDKVLFSLLFIFKPIEQFFINRIEAIETPDLTIAEVLEVTEEDMPEEVKKAFNDYKNDKNPSFMDFTSIFEADGTVRPKEMKTDDVENPKDEN
jgi:hypothetical protein